jgi:hypothetical protein
MEQSKVVELKQPPAPPHPPETFTGRVFASNCDACNGVDNIYAVELCIGPNHGHVVWTVELCDHCGRVVACSQPRESLPEAG